MKTIPLMDSLAVGAAKNPGLTTPVNKSELFGIDPLSACPIIPAAVSIVAVIALPLAFTSLAIAEGNTKGPGEESDPEFISNSSLDAQDKNIINKKSTNTTNFSSIKDITRLESIITILTIKTLW
ncbi:MAG: hypothetical protein PHS80_01130 [Methanothrix sp.]|nr:hypothetical protein [Methanothrix sp.]